MADQRIGCVSPGALRRRSRVRTRFRAYPGVGGQDVAKGLQRGAEPDKETCQTGGRLAPPLPRRIETPRAAVQSGREIFGTEAKQTQYLRQDRPGAEVWESTGTGRAETTTLVLFE